MPIAVGTGGFTTGRDCNLTLIGPYGKVVLNNVTGFKSAQQTASIHVDLLDGEQMDAALPKGWTFSFNIERGDPIVDALISRMEQDWLVNGNYTTGTLYQYVKELPGTPTSTMQFAGVTLKLSDAGTFSGDQSVKMMLEGTATSRNKIT